MARGGEFKQSIDTVSSQFRALNYHSVATAVFLSRCCRWLASIVEQQRKGSCYK